MIINLKQNYMNAELIKTDYTDQLVDLLEVSEDQICKTVENWISNHPYAEEGDHGYFCDYFDETELYELSEKLKELNVNVDVHNIAVLVENLKFRS